MTMDPRELAERVAKLITHKDFQEAEQLLLEEKKRAEAAADAQLMRNNLSELIELYCVMDPPSWVKATELSLKREQLARSSYSRLQTAMILHHGEADYARAVPKLLEAITQGKKEIGRAHV